MFNLFVNNILLNYVDKSRQFCSPLLLHECLFMPVCGCARRGISGQMHLRMSALNPVNKYLRHTPPRNTHKCIYRRSCSLDTRVCTFIGRERDAEGAGVCHLSRRIH